VAKSFTNMAKKNKTSPKRYWHIAVNFSVEAPTHEEAIKITDRICGDVKQDYGHYVHPVRVFAESKAKK
jgi:hypothetical protein